MAHGLIAGISALAAVVLAMAAMALVALAIAAGWDENESKLFA